MFCALLICIVGMVRICIFDIQSSNDAYQLIGNDVTLRGTIAESPILYAKEAGSVYLLKLDELVHQNGKKKRFQDTCVYMTTTMHFFMNQEIT